MAASTKHTIPTIGCDPEMFLTTMGGNPVPSCGLIGGSKKKPLILNEEIGLGVLEDNVTLEFNINPAKNIKEFHSRMRLAIDTISDFLKTKNLSTLVRTHCEFPLEELQKFPGAMTFGCDPDFDAFKQGEQRIPPDPSVMGKYRCAGHHIHFGYDMNKHKMPPWAIVKYLEAFVTLFDPDALQANGVRRKYYGLPGLYRPKEYGFEWRSPAGWLWSYFVGGAKSNTVVVANTILTGLLAAEKRAFDIHPLIDWDGIRGMLTQVQTNHNAAKFRQLQEDVTEFRQEFYDLGANILADDAADGAEEIVDIQRVPGPGGARHIPFGRPHFGEDAIVQDEPQAAQG